MRCYIPNFKHLSQVVLKKKILKYFSVYFYGLNLGPPVQGHLGPWDILLNKFGKGPPGMLQTIFQAPEPISSGEEDF